MNTFAAGVQKWPFQMNADNARNPGLNGGIDSLNGLGHLV